MEEEGRDKRRKVVEGKEDNGGRKVKELGEGEREGRRELREGRKGREGFRGI